MPSHCLPVLLVRKVLFVNGLWAALCWAGDVAGCMAAHCLGDAAASGCFVLSRSSIRERRLALTLATTICDAFGVRSDTSLLLCRPVQLEFDVS